MSSLEQKKVDFKCESVSFSFESCGKKNSSAA